MKQKTNPYTLVFTQPQEAVKHFLKQSDYRNIALFIFLLSAFLSLFGQYPGQFIEALASISVLFGGSFLYALVLMWWGGKISNKEYWKIYSSLSLAQIPLIFGRVIISGLLFFYFGKAALYNGVDRLIMLPSESFFALFVFLRRLFFLRGRCMPRFGSSLSCKRSNGHTHCFEFLSAA
jgi:hypothetical protein